jgi:hypothetical protein
MTFTIPVGFKRACHSNPQDVSDHAVTPSSPVIWTADPPTGVVSLLPAGVQSVDCWITGTDIGTATITVAQGGVTETATINVVAVPLDHFALTADPATPA